MSLINQMLQDLEKRGDDESSHAAAHYAQFGDVRGRSTSRVKLGLILICFSLLVIAAFYISSRAKQPAVTVAVNAEKPISSSAELVNSGVALASSKPAEKVQPDIVPTLGDVGLSLKLSTQVNAKALNSLTAQIHAQQEVPIAPQIENSTTNVRAAKLADNQEIVDAPKPATQSGAELNQTSNSNPAKKAPASLAKNLNSAPVTMIKEVSVQQRAEGEYRQATVYQQQGRVNEALAALESALKIDALHLPARQLLISLLLENKRHEDAIRELRQGLINEPGQLNFSMILARLLVERAKLTEAIEVLQKNAGLAQERPDYLAFLAALQQKTGHHKEAILLYRQALRVHSQNGAWWMGLGISLQAETNSQEAIDAYKQAKQQPGLSAELHAFIDQKISQLQK